jgi:uncharacterized protein
MTTCRDTHPSPSGTCSTPEALLFDAAGEPNLFVTEGSQLFAVDHGTATDLRARIGADDSEGLDALLRSLGVDRQPRIDDTAPDIPLRSISLAIAQRCNLGCSYCYAEGGSFGRTESVMSLDVAKRAVERLIRDCAPGERVNIAFLGGEPLTNREVLVAVTEFAAALAAARTVQAGFSITTNGTLLTAGDGAFFERHGFAVTVSLDGIGEVHDQLRPFKGGRGSFNRIIDRVQPLLLRQGRMQIAARVTVTPQNLRLPETLDHFIQLGFHSVGFAPMLASPTGLNQMEAVGLRDMLAQMIRCGEAFEANVLDGRRYPFTNMTNALREIDKGTHRPYPCGAGAGYLGVSAEGELFACHRFVGDEKGAMGDITSGVDARRQHEWLRQRHVHFQEPCNGCWARYLCGGGCHHEVLNRGRPACDYIRGWLEYCLQAYVRLQKARPHLFGLTAAADASSL